MNPEAFRDLYDSQLRGRAEVADADEAVDEQTGSDLEGNANDDVVETEDAG